MSPFRPCRQGPSSSAPTKEPSGDPSPCSAGPPGRKPRPRSHPPGSLGRQGLQEGLAGPEPPERQKEGVGPARLPLGTPGRHGSWPARQGQRWGRPGVVGVRRALRPHTPVSLGSQAPTPRAARGPVASVPTIPSVHLLGREGWEAPTAPHGACGGRCDFLPRQGWDGWASPSVSFGFRGLSSLTCPRCLPSPRGNMAVLPCPSPLPGYTRLTHRRAPVASLTALPGHANVSLHEVGGRGTGVSRVPGLRGGRGEGGHLPGCQALPRVRPHPAPQLGPARERAPSVCSSLPPGPGHHPHPPPPARRRSHLPVLPSRPWTLLVRGGPAHVRGPGCEPVAEHPQSGAPPAQTPARGRAGEDPRPRGPTGVAPAPPREAHTLTGSPLGPFSPGAPLRPASPCGRSGDRVLRPGRPNPRRPLLPCRPDTNLLAIESGHAVPPVLARHTLGMGGGVRPGARRVSRHPTLPPQAGVSVPAGGVRRTPPSASARGFSPRPQPSSLAAHFADEKTEAWGLGGGPSRSHTLDRCGNREHSPVLGNQQEGKLSEEAPRGPSSSPWVGAGRG